MIIARVFAAVAALAATMLLTPASALADWRRAETEHFVIYSDRSESGLREYASMLEDFDALLRSRHPNLDETVSGGKLDIYLVGGISQLRRALPSAPDHLAGIYTASNNGIFAIAVREAGGRDDQTSGDDVVLHEYVHHFMMQNHKASYPAWLIEGYAEYYATVDLTPKKIVIGSVSPNRAYSLNRPGWLDMGSVLSKRVMELKESDRSAFYAQSWLLTHYILSDNDRRAKFNVYLAEWRKTGDSIGAWKKAFGEDPKDLKRSLDRYIAKPLMGRIITREAPPAPQITVTRLSDGADDVLLETLQLRRPVPKNDQPELLQKMRALYTRRPDDRFTRMAAARAETDFGDRAAGEALLQTMIAKDPSDYEAMVVLAQSHIARARADRASREEEFVAARKLLASAAKLQPDDFRIYLLSAQTRVGDPGKPSENTLNVLARAVQLAPQARDLRMLAAITYMRAGGAEDEVRALLEPLLTDPHGGALTTRAQAMIANLDKAAGGNVQATAPGATETDAAEGDQGA